MCRGRVWMLICFLLQCSATCGHGVRTRDVRCVNDDGRNDSTSAPVSEEKPLDDSLCQEEKPLGFLRCRVKKCPRWRRSKWSLCSVSCGDGIRTRKVVCAEGKRHTLPDERCAAERSKPLEVAKCRRTHCPVYHWLTTRWSKCSESCGQGRQLREVYCVNNYRQRAPPSMCNAQQKPVAVHSCVSTTCPYLWVPGPWSTCSKSCGEGEQFRALHCQLKSSIKAKVLATEKQANGQDGPQVPIYHCAKLPQPSVRRSCSSGSCESSYFWVAGDWSQCSITCGWGVQNRRVRCLSRESKLYVRGKCLEDLRPKRQRRCFVGNCESSDCAEARQRLNTTVDGHYDILVSGRKIQLYCYGMNESHPKEYLTLAAGERSNYAEFYGKRLLYPFTCPHNGDRNDSCQCTDETSAKPGLTRFSKVRIDLQNMKINVMDRQFAVIEYGEFVPYGTAGDCYSSVNCPQGQFSVDLRNTGLKVSDKTEWQDDGHRTSKQVTRFEQGAAVQGRCGGYCGKCFPSRRFGLLVEIDTRQLP